MQIEVTPGQQIGGSVALVESTQLPRFESRCSVGGFTLTPIEDWGVNLERKRNLVQITLQDALPLAEFMPGLAPTRYAVSAELIIGCRLRGQPVLDMSGGGLTGVQAEVMEPGIIRGRAEVAYAAQPREWEVLLIPDDFAEGLAFLPGNWFRSQNAGIRFGWGRHWDVDGPGWLPYLRIGMVQQDWSFEFRKVPAGHYRIAVRSTDLRSADPNSTPLRGFTRVNLPAGGVVELTVKAEAQQ